MIARVVKVIAIVTLVILSVGLFISVRSLLTFPFSLINVVFIAITFLLFLTQPSYTLWYSFAVGFILELYALTPFGVLLVSLLTSVMLGSYAYQRLFTNVSFLSLVALLCVIIFAHRVVLLALTALFGDPVGTTVAFETIHLFWELVLNSVVLLLVYLLARAAHRALRPEFVRR